MHSLTTSGVQALHPLRTTFLMLGIAGAVACTTPSGPEHTIEAYARALKEGRVDDAFGLTSDQSRTHLDRDAFRARYQEPAARERRATEVLASLPSVRARTPEIEATRERGTWRVVEPGADEGPRAALTAFLDAVEQGDFAAAYGLLSSSWRQRYTPDRFAADFKAEPLSKERLKRARAALTGAQVVLREGAAEYPISQGRAVQLVREPEGFRVVALE